MIETCTSNSLRVADMLEQHGVDRIGYLPCERTGTLAARLADRAELWHLTREAAGVPMAFGWHLGGLRAALLMQSTGLGNLVTELMTLQVLYGVGLPLLVSWRGHYKEEIGAQVILGERLPAMLKALGIPAHEIDSAADLELLDAGIGRCYDQSTVEVFLLSPELWEDEASGPTEAVGAVELGAVEVSEPSYIDRPEMTRYQAIKTVVDDLDEDTVVVSQIGYPTRELYAIRDHPRHVYLLGALGSASLVGLGLAQARPELDVVVLDGDGAYIFNPNQLLEIAQEFPRNLQVVLLDNGAWGSTGSQPTMTSRGLNLAALGRAAGLPRFRRVVTPADWTEHRKAPVLHVLIQSGNAQVGTVPLAPRQIVNRFKEATFHG